MSERLGLARPWVMNLTNPEDRSKLKPRVLCAWAQRGRYMDEIHAWAFAPRSVEDTEARVLYLLSELDLETQCDAGNDRDLHPEVRVWRSEMLLFVNQIHGGSVPRLRSDHWRDGLDAPRVRDR